MNRFKERMQEVLPLEELPVFFQALDELGKAPKKSVRLNRRRIGQGTWDRSKGDSSDSLELRLIQEGIPVVGQVLWYDLGFFFELAGMDPHPSLHPLLACGSISIQEAGAMEVVPALGVEPDHWVLDLCAAPGGKSTHIGEYLGEKGWLVANDPHRERAKVLDVVLARHGTSRSTVYNLEPHELAKRFGPIFDRVLVDAPCSGESLFAKRKEERKDVSHKEVERCALRQMAILSSAARLCRPGGRIVYSTCAYSRQENEEVLSAFLAENPDFSLIREQRRFPHRDGVPGGYFAVLLRNLVSTGDAKSIQRTDLRMQIREAGTRGLIRDGIRRWNGELDFYAWAMDQMGGHEQKFEDEKGFVSIPLERKEVIQLLSLEPKTVTNWGSVQRGWIEWKGKPIAPIVDGVWLYPKGRLR